MKLIEDFIKHPLVIRQTHLNLDEPCIERGGNSSDFRGLMADWFDVTIPTKKQQIYLCHACNNAKCGNPKHLYWGTPKENHDDKVRAGRWKNPWDSLKLKSNAKQIQSESGRLGGKALKGRPSNNPTGKNQFSV